MGSSKQKQEEMRGSGCAVEELAELAKSQILSGGVVKRTKHGFFCVLHSPGHESMMCALAAIFVFRMHMARHSLFLCPF